MVNYSFDDLLITSCKEIIANGFETKQIPDTIKDWLSGKIIRSLPKSLVQQLISFLIDNRSFQDHVGCRRNLLGDEFTILFYRSDVHKKRKEEKFLKGERNYKDPLTYEEDLSMFKGDIELMSNGIDLYAEELIEEKYGPNIASMMISSRVENQRKLKRYNEDSTIRNNYAKRPKLNECSESDRTPKNLINERNRMMQLFENAANNSQDDITLESMLESREQDYKKKQANERSKRRSKDKSSGNEKNKIESKSRKYCPVEGCDKSYVEQFRLKNHMNREHLDYLKENPEKYELFTKGRITENHKKCIQYDEIQWDENNNIYTCMLCPAKFTTPWKIVRHVENIHLKVKNYSCDTCGKSYQTKERLNQHLMTHSGEKPFVCDYCGKGFIRKDKLKEHKKLGHKDEWREEQRLGLLSKLSELSEPTG